MIIICFSIYTLSVHLLLQKALIYESQAKRIHTLPIPPNLILGAHSCKFFWPAAYLVREMIKDCVLWVSVLAIHPIAKMRIGQNILFPRTGSERKTYLNKKWKEKYYLGKED